MCVDGHFSGPCFHSCCGLSIMPSVPAGVAVLAVSGLPKCLSCRPHMFSLQAHQHQTKGSTGVSPRIRCSSLMRPPCFVYHSFRSLHLVSLTSATFTRPFPSLFLSHTTPPICQLSKRTSQTSRISQLCLTRSSSPRAIRPKAAAR